MKRSYNINESTPILSESKKIVLFGEADMGKSTFFEKLNKLHDSDYTFQKKYKSTDNFDFNRIHLTTDNGIIIIDLWDTAGQESRGGKVRDAYLKGAEGVLLFYDVSNKKSINNITTWLEQIKTIAPNVPVAVIGNKSDTLKDLQQSESVKIREKNLERDIGHKNIKNFLISIKENTHLESSSSYWSSTITTKEEEGCLVGLEYVLSNIFNKALIIKN